MTLLDQEKDVSTHTRNLQILVTEMFEVKVGELPSIMYEMFQIDDSNDYNFRKNRGFKPDYLKPVYYGNKTIFVLGPKLWIILSGKYKNSTILKDFKTKKIKS